MVSTTVQVSLLLSEMNLLAAESNRQVAMALRERLDAQARGETVPKLRTVGPATVAAQIIRAALPELEVKLEKDKKNRIMKVAEMSNEFYKEGGKEE